MGISFCVTNSVAAVNYCERACIDKYLDLGLVLPVVKSMFCCRFASKHTGMLLIVDVKPEVSVKQMEESQLITRK